MPLGDAALLVRVADSLGKVLATAQTLQAARLPGVAEVAPAVASVAVYLQSPRDMELCVQAIHLALCKKATVRKSSARSRLIEIPICYAPAYGLDLEIVAAHTQLSPNEIALCHWRTEYRVRCLGFTPGFPYLSGLSRALATPRRASPRTIVPRGSVAIGGAQTGIYPLSSPGGWNIIGRTPLRLFDAIRQPASLLRAGDRVRFVAIDEAEFERWEQ